MTDIEKVSSNRLNTWQVSSIRIEWVNFRTNNGLLVDKNGVNISGRIKRRFRSIERINDFGWNQVGV